MSEPTQAERLAEERRQRGKERFAELRRQLVQIAAPTDEDESEKSDKEGRAP